MKEELKKNGAAELNDCDAEKVSGGADPWDEYVLKPITARPDEHNVMLTEAANEE